jgi:phosphate transport system permease protein
VLLAIMVVPYIAAVCTDVFRAVPQTQREAALALGATRWEMVRIAVLPYGFSGVIGAIMLGLGRALGETMAVAMVCGVSLGAVSSNIYGTMTTISATIVTQLDSALSDGTGFSVRTIAELALVLMVITLAVNVAARLLVRKVSGTALPVGRGV